VLFRSIDLKSKENRFSSNLLRRLLRLAPCFSQILFHTS